LNIKNIFWNNIINIFRNFRRKWSGLFFYNLYSFLSFYRQNSDKIIMIFFFQKSKIQRQRMLIFNFKLFIHLCNSRIISPNISSIILSSPPNMRISFKYFHTRDQSYYLSIGRLHKFSKHEEYRRFGSIFQIVWVLWVLITLLLTTVFEFWDDIFFKIASNEIWYFIRAIVWLVCITQAAVLIFQRKPLIQKKEIYKLWLLTHLIIFIILWSVSSEIWIIIANFYFVLVLLYLLYIGVKYANKRYINLAFLFFIIFLIVKYVDIFDSMLSQSLFLMAWGLFFIIWWYFLEKLRRKVNNFIV